MGYDFSTQLRGVRQISPGNVVKPTGIETGVSGWPGARAFSCPSSQYERAADAPVLVLTPFAGASVIVKAFAIVIIGGFGNVEGTIIAGLIVGLIESYTTQVLGPGLIDIVVFALLLLMLAVRPTGLIAERREENV